MRLVIYVLLLGFVAFTGYVRLAPTDLTRWNVAPAARPAGDYRQKSGFLAVRDLAPADTLMQLAQIAVATPRTRLVAGSVDSGLVTFVTRSALWGFPDYTTAQLDKGSLRIFGRLRFGRSDLGVNEARILAWLAALDL